MCSRDRAALQVRTGQINHPPWMTYIGHAFTLLELLAVIAVIGLIAAMLLPALARAKEAARQALCTGNMRQLALVLNVYSADNGQAFPNNGYGSEQTLQGNKLWVVGDEHINPPSFTNVAYLTNPRFAQFADYIQEPRIYKCPSDRGQVPINGKWLPHTRSYALNSYFGWLWPPASWNNPRYVWFMREADLSQTTPSSILTFIETAPGNICHSAFVIYIGPLTGLFYHIPSAQHMGGANLVFADGHIEKKRWLEGWTIEMARTNWLPNHLSLYSQGNRDLEWLQRHATALRR